MASDNFCTEYGTVFAMMDAIATLMDFLLFECHIQWFRIDICILIKGLRNQGPDEYNCTNTPKVLNANMATRKQFL